MAEYRQSRDPISEAEEKSGWGRTIALWVIVFALLMGVLFATGFWKAQVQHPGSLPDINVRVVGGLLPSVIFESRKDIAGTPMTPVDAPTLGAKSGTGAPDKLMHP